MLASLSREELLSWAAESAAFYGIDLSRIGTILLTQAFSFAVNRVFSTFDLTAPIKALEGLRSSCTTGPEDQFQHPPLTGLYKKHFTSPRFIPTNLINFLRSKEGVRHFNEVWGKATQASGTGYIDDIFTKYLTHHMVFPPIEMKNSTNRMTGEWVVFHKHEEKNYYLTFASHRETNDEIYKRVALGCEFDKLPFKL